MIKYPCPICNRRACDSNKYALLGITCHSIVCNIKLLYHVCVL